MVIYMCFIALMIYVIIKVLTGKSWESILWIIQIKALI